MEYTVVLIDNLTQNVTESGSATLGLTEALTIRDAPFEDGRTSTAR